MSMLEVACKCKKNICIGLKITKTASALNSKMRKLTDYDCDRWRVAAYHIGLPCVCVCLWK